MAIRRDILNEIGGFDERYFLHREDTDLAWRVIDAGYRMVWVPECTHHPEPIGTMVRYTEAYPRSEQLLYHCNPKKFVESAASMISRESLTNGSLRRLQREMRTGKILQTLSHLAGFNLGSLTKAWLLAFFWAIRKGTVGDPSTSSLSIGHGK